ncbi:MAG: hypothetical protein JEY96_15825 [Bacteroidales bacterium]|nr:hypothetical protein [Bacteroidales bacterium]
MYEKALTLRYNKTLNFLNNCVSKEYNILDLGTKNRFSELMQENNYNITNTKGEDLDINFDVAKDDQFDLVTAFEIFEHMFCPFNILKSIKAKELIASIPLKLWFAGAYWGKDDWDKHFHEFEEKQFNLLLDKTGWKIIKSEKWTNPTNKIGIRPILRKFTARYYIVHCVRK